MPSSLVSTRLTKSLQEEFPCFFRLLEIPILKEENQISVSATKQVNRMFPSSQQNVTLLKVYIQSKINVVKVNICNWFVQSTGAQLSGRCTSNNHFKKWRWTTLCHSLMQELRIFSSRLLEKIEIWDTLRNLLYRLLQYSTHLEMNSKNVLRLLNYLTNYTSSVGLSITWF